jgi:predicted Rossmann fold nucleotide-binding protein DprA/Smf involved in DNA uptake
LGGKGGKVSERVAIIGSRTWKNRLAICDAIKRLKPGTVIISGGASGADSIAEVEGLAAGFVTVTVNAPWEVHGKAAGPIRNTVIADLADRCIAFWDGESPGTKMTIGLFTQMRKHVLIVDPDLGVKPVYKKDQLDLSLEE